MRTDRALLASLVLPLLAACSSPTEGVASDPALPTREAAAPRPPSAELEQLIARGRVLLDAGQPLEAEALFARAAESDGQSLRTRMWVLRAWMDQGRSNDTLDALDQLDRSGEKGLDMTYLYGMAFARRAEGYVADGVSDSSVQMNFQDATHFLKQAVDADGKRYHDAYQPLARAAWYVQELDTARWAADRAIEASADAPESWLARGRIAMTQFVLAEGEQPGGPEASTLWTDATTSLRRAVELFGTPTTPQGATSLAQAATELGHGLLWKQKASEATEAYAIAIAWAPETFNYAQTQDLLRRAPASEGGPNAFRSALEEGHRRFDARATDASAASTTPLPSATLLWWLGWARFADADWAGSEEAFRAALALAPEVANAWFYVGLARQYRNDPEGAITAMHRGWDTEPAAMVATAANAEGSLRAFENLIVWCATQEPARNLDGAFLAEMLAEARPDEARHWNNMGLFLRDAGEELEITAYRNKTPEPDEAVLSDLYERSWRAYSRALELNPDDPQLLNDTALMLHYHLGRDLDQAEAMYRRAIALVEQKLSASDLSEDDRAALTQTKSDTEENLQHLLEPEKEKATEESADPASPATPAAPEKPE